MSLFVIDAALTQQVNDLLAHHFTLITRRAAKIAFRISVNIIVKLITLEQEKFMLRADDKAHTVFLFGFFQDILKHCPGVAFRALARLVVQLANKEGDLAVGELKHPQTFNNREHDAVGVVDRCQAGD